MATKAKKKAPARRRKKETTHIGFLIDESGSMSSNKSSVIEGYNEFITELGADTGDKDVRATLGTFTRNGFNVDSGSVVRTKFDSLPLEKVRELTGEDYRPSGSTPLNDAVIETIETIEVKTNKSDKVMLVVMTDGYENASNAPSSKVRDLIARKEADGWVFLYLGADQDSWSNSEAIGLAGVGKSFDTSGSVRGTRSALKSAGNAARLFASVTPAQYTNTMERLSAETGSALPEDAEIDLVAYNEGASIEEARKLTPEQQPSGGLSESDQAKAQDALSQLFGKEQD